MELLLRVGADLPLVFIGNTVWRIKRRPVCNSWRQEQPPYRSLKAGATLGARASDHKGSFVRDPGIWLCRLAKRSLEREA